MKGAARALGEFGERYAARMLARAGYPVLARNVRAGAGEIDIVARDGDTLVFVEVRTRRSGRFGTPEESVTPAKARRMVRAALEYLAREGLEAWPWRIDLVALEVDRAGRVRRAEHLRNALA